MSKIKDVAQCSIQSLTVLQNVKLKWTTEGNNVIVMTCEKQG